MLIKDIISADPKADTQLSSIISKQCTQFINESGGFPLCKNLPTSYTDIHKVKVRRQKRKNEITDSFNEAFKNQLHNLRQRAIFATGSIDLPIIENQEVFYVFPIDGYKFMYNSEVINSGEEYKEAFDIILEQLGDDKDEATKIVTDLLQYTYTSNDLTEGLHKGAEIIMYNIPYYYAVRGNMIDDYHKMLTSLAQ